MNWRVFFALVLLPLDFGSLAHAADKPALKVLIDASKDGGVWWFPQSKNFDAKAAHQGKPLADALRAKGYGVNELGRGTEVTAELLRAANIVIRPRVFFPYAAAEIDAYWDAITGGLPVVLIAQPAASSDQLGNKLGFEFGEFQEIGGLYMVRKHSLADGLSTVPGPWTNILKQPEDATVIGSMLSGRPIAALRVVEKGAVIVLGSPMHESTAAIVNLVALTTKSSASDLNKELIASKEERVNPTTGPLPPDLVEPAKEAILRQGKAASWRFKWTPVEKAAGYELIVYGATASLPLVNIKTAKTAHDYKIGSGVVVGRNKLNWTWSVRAKDAKGVWGDWAATRKFDVE